VRIRSAVVALLTLSVPAVGAAENPHRREGTAEEAEVPAEAPQAAGGGEYLVELKSEVAGYADTDAVSVLTPAVAATVTSPLTGWSANGSYLIDIVSAASVDIVSTASPHWTEVRHAGAVGATYKPDVFGASVSGSVSREPDYLSLSVGGALLLELVSKTVNPTLGYTFTSDTAGRKDTPFSVFSQELTRHTGQLSVELIADPFTVLGFGVDVILERGDQSKGYRFLPVFTPEIAASISPGTSVDEVNRLRLPGRMSEHLPEERTRVAMSGRLAQRLAGSTFIFTERVYTDDWGLLASTSDLRFLMDASSRVAVWTHLRGHFQSGVSFYETAYSVVSVPGGPPRFPRWRTGDRELSPLSSGTFGAGARWHVGPDTRPSAFGLVAQADVMTTLFREALYIRNRQGYLGLLQLEVEL
jgi:hypothetical protein